MGTGGGFGGTFSRGVIFFPQKKILRGCGETLWGVDFPLFGAGKTQKIWEKGGGFLTPKKKFFGGPFKKKPF